jgi:hypothetical protein
VIVSFEHNFAFLKVPKTAGTSVELFLEPLAGADAIVTRITPPEPGHEPRNSANTPGNVARALWAARSDGDALKRTWTTARRKENLFYNHMPARLARERIGTKRWDSLYRFCFDRNSWDKSISRYFWRTRQLAARPPFDDWALVPGNLPTARRVYTIDEKLAVDFLGRYEQLAEDLATVMKTVGVTVPVDLPRAKSMVRPKGARTSVGEKADAAIRQAFAWEIDYFGFERPEGIPWEPQPDEEQVAE